MGFMEDILPDGWKNVSSDHRLFWNVCVCVDCIRHDLDDKELPSGLYQAPYEQTQYLLRDH